MELQTENGAAPAVAETPSIVPADAAAQAAQSARESMEAVWNRHNPPRAKNGEFAAQEKRATDNSAAAAETPAEQAVETGEAAAKQETPDQPQEEASKPAEPAIAPPYSWSAEMRAKFGSLPPDVQKYVSEREGEAHRAITQQGEMVKAIQPFAQLVDRHKTDFERQGVTPLHGIGVLLQANARLEADPPAFLYWLAEQYGVDLNQLAEHARSQPRPDPEVLALKRELGELKSGMTAAQRAQQEAELASAARDLTAFGKDKPHFDAVRQHMGVLLGTGLAANLEDAYEQATHALPDVRQRIQEDQRRADEAKRKAEAEKQAAAAKKAASINVRSSSGASPAVPKNMRETMEQVFDRLAG